MGSSLLSSESSNSDEDSTTDSGTTEGQLEIVAETSEITVNVDDTDKIEITGKCVDLDRRKNRIFVEVFAGEDENATPFISNAISDQCQTTEAGLLPGETCFWVTKGIGIVEGPPVNRSFPQCHDGVFGFAVKLGKILNSGATNLKYTIRFKLRTLDGILSDSQWGLVSVSRNLSNPSLDRVSANDLASSCLIEASAARFNQQISYMLTKTGTGNGAAVAMGNVYPGRLLSSLLSPNFSVYSWEDRAGIIAGATFTYTLDSRHDAAYVPAYVTVPTATSNTLTCTLVRPQIFMPVPPTNATAGTGPTCYIAPSGGRANSNAGVTLQWGVATTAGWTGVDGNFNGLFTTPFNCVGSITNCTSHPLVAGVQYYFAFREINSSGVTGKWSNEVACIPPPP